MTHRTILLSVAILGLALTGCADGGTTETGDTALALTEALDACLDDLRACRADADQPPEACRELMACLPERDEDRTSATDWRTYCDGVEARCADGVVDDETCEELMERCVDVDGATHDAQVDAHGACYRTCVEDGGDEGACRAECYEAAPSTAAQPEMSVEACMASCQDQGVDQALCSERCGML